MSLSIKKIVNKMTGPFGLTVVNKRTADKMYIPFDIDPAFEDLYKKTEPYTMTTLERMFSLYKAVQYITHHSIPGDIVECGVYKGGSVMLCAYTLQQNNDTSRHLYLYDTFTGMDEPTAEDIAYNKNERQAIVTWKQQKKNGYVDWAYAPLDEVRINMKKTGYPKNRIYYIKGKVEDTIPKTIPEQIALLRLDTDFYDSTKHNLEHLFPRLVLNGVLIIDDYGSWRGCRKAVDEYMEKHNITILLTQCDHSCAIGIKTR